MIYVNVAIAYKTIVFSNFKEIELSGQNSQMQQLISIC